VYSAALLKPKPNEWWLLVTIAPHMPRAVGCFRAAGFQGAAVSDSVGSPRLFAPYATGSVDFGRELRPLRIGRALGHAVENEMAHLPHLVS
jgi:uncharacterized SAM-binding protein YcdF (DUF218 family)